MVKQGRFAKSSKLKQIKQIRRRMHHPAGRIIQPDQFEEFVLVRYGLTLKKKYKGTDKETMQRFLMEVLAAAAGQNSWRLTAIIPETFKRINVRVPYQFYQRVLRNWDPFVQFLNREIPAVPLKDRIVLSGSLTEEQLNGIIASQLAANTLLATGNTQLLKMVTAEQTDSLEKSLMTGNQVDWQKVAKVFNPIPFDTSTAPDQRTKQWLDSLKEL
ncbi:hypothetical protein [Lentilactobacillus kisonensis]|uniref:Uncharacterized protein n=1 Tax=Lentilactobacillus kisonensis DSM 19906 = JCM 15041 TaxID=1423766 RepID=A0A0R1NK78_9LACO|nr:hypothetical protein [Lentilactobacillus kisonensis]KRL20364.1 hypothetical protein FC98_GL001537 [Lentilactobacillus kisonensis DSM 19906 = JCM 15041]